MSFRLVPKSVTLNDLERRNGPYFAVFHRLRVRCRRKTIILGLSGFQNLLLIVYDHINTICAIIQRLFGQNKRRQWPLLQTQLPTPISPDEFLVAVGGSIVQHSGWTGESTLSVGASISVDAQQKLEVCSMAVDAGLYVYDVIVKKFTFAISSPGEFL